MHDDLPCREFVELVTDYLDEILPAELRMAFEEHLQVCSGCRLYLGQMRIAISALREPQSIRLNAHARDRLVRLFGEWRAQQGI